MKTTDLGNNWYATQEDDGGFTLRSPDRGQRITLSKEETDRLREMFRTGEADRVRAA